MVRIAFDGIDQLDVPSAEMLLEELSTGGTDGRISGTDRRRGADGLVLFVTELTMSGVGVSVLGGLVARLRDRFRRGVVVDVRGPEPVLTTDRRLPWGAVVIVGPDGVPQHVPPESLDTVLARYVPQGGAA